MDPYLRLFGNLGEQNEFSQIFKKEKKFYHLRRQHRGYNPGTEGEYKKDTPEVIGEQNLRSGITPKNINNISE